MDDQATEALQQAAAALKRVGIAATQTVEQLTLLFEDRRPFEEAAARIGPLIAAQRVRRGQLQAGWLPPAVAACAIARRRLLFQIPHRRPVQSTRHRCTPGRKTLQRCRSVKR